MAWPSARHKTATNGGSWTPADMNGVQDQYVRSAGVERDDLEQAITQQLGLTTTVAGHGGAAVRRGKSIIATEESRTNAAYGTLPTPDRVQNIVLPTDGLIFVVYTALVKESIANDVRVALFLGANQVKSHPTTSGAPVVMEKLIGQGAGVPNRYMALTTLADGFDTFASSGDITSRVTTGQTFGFFGSGAAQKGGVPIMLDAAAGTYDVSIQFKGAAGTVTAKERKLLVWTLGF